jgi:hypothetical protein
MLMMGQINGTDKLDARPEYEHAAGRKTYYSSAGSIRCRARWPSSLHVHGNRTDVDEARGGGVEVEAQKKIHRRRDRARLSVAHHLLALRCADRRHLDAGSGRPRNRDRRTRSATWLQSSARRRRGARRVTTRSM